MVGSISTIEIAHNEITWADKETCLVDGDVEGLRMHHNYVHDAHNRPWAWGIAPNGYNAPWRSCRASGLQVVTDSDSVLRNPEAGDFRLSSGSALLETGAAIDTSGVYDAEFPNLHRCLRAGRWMGGISKASYCYSKNPQVNNLHRIFTID